MQVIDFFTFVIGAHAASVHNPNHYSGADLSTDTATREGGVMAIESHRAGRGMLAVALVALAAAPLARAADYDVADGKLSVHGSVFLGTAIRTAKQDTELLPNVNSSLVGITGTAITPSTGKNQDDGNLNFNRGDAVATVVKGYLTLDYKWRDYGALASGKAWYDWATAQGTYPWGNLPNNFTAGASLSDDGALARSKFSGIVADDLYVYGRNQFDKMSLDWTIGYQKLDWGNRYNVLGGLRDLTPLDLPAAVRPGVLRDQETRIAFPAVFARLGLTKTTNLEAFYQIHFQRNAPNECGTFFAQQDFVSEGCDKVVLGQGSDRQSIATGAYVKRAGTPAPSNAGQGGVALKQMIEDWGTEFGIYAAQFHSRASFYSAIKSLRTGAPFIPGDPGNLNPQYYTEFPEDIRIFGATFDTKFRGGAVFGEITYRPNQPLQYNSADLISAFTSLTAPTPLRAQATATAPGAMFHAWERHDTVQAQLGATATIPGVLGAAGLTLGGEIIYKGVPDLPDPSVTRFGRSDVFGQGPVNGVCPPPAVPTQCSFDGYVSRNAFAYRLRAGLRYANVMDGVDLTPSVFFGQDVSGWSNDNGILQGRMLAIAALRANFARGWTAEVSWQPTWGGTYNNLRDRSTAQANVGYQF